MNSNLLKSGMITTMMLICASCSNTTDQEAKIVEETNTIHYAHGKNEMTFLNQPSFKGTYMIFGAQPISQKIRHTMLILAVFH